MHPRLAYIIQYPAINISQSQTFGKTNKPSKGVVTITIKCYKLQCLSQIFFDGCTHKNRRQNNNNNHYRLHYYYYHFTALWILSGTAQVRRYQKGKTNLDLLEQEIVSGSGISWDICKSAPHPRQPHQHLTTQFLQASCASGRSTNSVKALKTVNHRQKPK